MRIKLLGIFIMAALFSASCVSLKLNSATKRKVYPGTPQGREYVSYELSLTSSKGFSIKDLKLGDKPIESYSMQNQKTLVYEDVKKNDFAAGNYKLFFKVYESGAVSDNDTITLTINQNGKDKTFRSAVVPLEALHKR